MSTLKPGWLILRLSLVYLIPLATLVWGGHSILDHHLKITVVNDPEQALVRDLSAVKLSVDQPSQQWLLKASRETGRESLRKELSYHHPLASHLKALGGSVADALQAPLLVLADSKADVFFDDLGLAEGVTQAPEHSKSHKKHEDPSPSIKHWTGVEAGLKGSSATGVLTYKDKPYLAALAPIGAPGHTQGVLLAGEPLDGAFMAGLKNACQADLALAVDRKVLLSTLPSSYTPDIDKALAGSAFGSSGPSHRKPLRLDGQDYLWDEVALTDLDQNPYGYLLVFQPSKRTLTVEGDPQGSIRRLGGWLLLGAVLLFLLAAADLLAGLRRLHRAASQAAEGDLTPGLPEKRRDELGSLYRAFNDMALALRERERLSLVLGKVLAPQVAKRLLADRDHFALKGEKRECTLLYAELKGFNPLSENLAPDRLVEVLNQYFSLAHGAVFQQEGMLDKFMGESFLAVWGAPFLHDDKEVRALKAAQAIHAALKDLNLERVKKGQPAFQWGIGVYTGPVVTGNLGSNRRNDYTVIGPAVEAARRLCAKAAPGQTLMDRDTYGKVETLVRVQELEPMALPGVPEPLQVYEVVELI